MPLSAHVEATISRVVSFHYDSSISESLSILEKQIKHLTVQVKEVIKRLVSETEFQVRQAMSDEIRRLSLLVDEFDKPFHQNQMVLQVYKDELYRHVEEGMFKVAKTLWQETNFYLEKLVDLHLHSVNVQVPMNVGNL